MTKYTSVCRVYSTPCRL